MSPQRQPAHLGRLTSEPTGSGTTKVLLRHVRAARAVGLMMRTSNAPGTMLGAWRITEMELWDGEAVDLMGPALIEFGQDQTGRFRFIAVEGWMDCRHEQRDGRPHVEFSWEGDDDSDPAHGRGWATLANDGSLQGRIYFHMGDDSGFRAVRAVQRSESNAGTAGRAAGRRR